MKKIVTTLLISAFLTSLGYADETTYTLDLAKATGLENNIQSHINELEVQRYTQELIDANEDALMQGDSYGQSSVYNARIAKNVTPLLAQANLDKAIATKDRNLDIYNDDILKLFMEIDMQEKEIVNLEQKFEISKTKLQNKKNYYSLNLVTFSEVSNLEYTVSSDQYNLEVAKNELDKVYLELKEQINISLETEIDIEYNQALLTLKIVDLNTLIIEGLKKDIDIQLLEAKKEAAQKTMDVALGVYKVTDTQVLKDKISLNTAQLNLNKAINSYTSNIKNLYSEYLTLKSNYELSKTYSKLNLDNQAAMINKYSLNLITLETLNDTKQTYNNALYSESVALTNLNLKIIEISNELGL
jgi:outer membrane protein TolC